MNIAQNRDLQHIGLWLRSGGILIGGFVCVSLLSKHGNQVIPSDVVCLSILAIAFRMRELVIRRNDHGAPLLSYHPGDSIVAIAMLRGGPMNAMVVAMVSMLASLITERNNPGPTRILRLLLNFTYYPALICLGAYCYLWLGGKPIHTMDDSSMFFREPSHCLLPLFFATVITTELINRVYQAALIRCSSGRQMLTTLADPLFSAFEYVELLGATIALVLFSAWGWQTIPYSAVTLMAMLIATRGYFQSRDSKRVSEVDHLTGTASWHRLERHLKKRMTGRRRESRLALLFLDVDNLKEVNDRYGHSAGDELLQLIGKTCREIVRDPDVVCRRSGDEFIILLHNLDRMEASLVRERLRDHLNNQVSRDDRFFITAAGVSIGIAAHPGDGTTAEELIDAADRQMYVDKRERKAYLNDDEPYAGRKNYRN
ncbi:MAG: GGDEF domain-containing protein [Chthonomonadales bacterium]